MGLAGGAEAVGEAVEVQGDLAAVGDAELAGLAGGQGAAVGGDPRGDELVAEVVGDVAAELGEGGGVERVDDVDDEVGAGDEARWHGGGGETMKRGGGGGSKS